MNIIKKLFTLAVAAGISIPAFADGGVIQGYFRVQNVGNNNYVEVTGPFTAKPNVSEADAQSSAGTIMYIDAVQNGNAYIVNSLRCQGIDVVGDPISYEDYESIFEGAGSTNASSLVYGMFQQGFKYGYTNFARATVGSIFLFVASYLDGYQEGTPTYTKDDFKELVDRFNRDVTAQLDLGIRLAPVEGKPNTVQLYFDVPSFQPVCDWYENSENYAIFTAATQAMSNYLKSNGKGITLETFYPVDVQLFQDWGYDIKTATGVEASGENYYASFETIFKDPVLLFNWVKWVGYMILNPESASAQQHDMESLSIVNDKLGDINLKGHYLTDMLISYLPRLHYDTRAYLINGKVVGDNGDFSTGATYKWDASADGTLGFANEREVTYVAGDHANWVLVPVDNTSANGKFMVNLPTEWTDESGSTNYYGALYYDFPVITVDTSTTLNTLSTTNESMGYQYVTLEPQTSGVDAQVAMVISSSENQIQLNVATGECTFTELDPSLFEPEEPSAPKGSIPVTDEEVLAQKVKRRATTVSNSDFKGVLLATDYSRITDYWNINTAINPVYSVFKNDKVLSNDHLLFELSTDNLLANQAIYVYPNTRNSTNMVIINAPEIEVTVNDTDTGEEETPTNIKIAQEFQGDGSNVFDGLISLPANLNYGTDFTINMTAPNSAGTSGNPAWSVPSNSSNLNASYEDAFLSIQPKPSDYSGSDYVPSLYTQYLDIINSEGDNPTVDGFYLTNYSIVAEATGEQDENGDYTYNIHFDAPCSGVYEMTIVGKGDYTGMHSGPHKIKIYPNLYANFGSVQGLNINSYSATKIQDGASSTGDFETGDYVIYFPEDYALTELLDAIAYIPGTYFATSLTSDAPEVSGDNPDDIPSMRRRAAAYPDTYYTKMDLSSYLNVKKPVTFTVEKNGVSASYPFYLATTTNQDEIITAVDRIEENDGKIVYYNLQGLKVENPKHGIFIKVANGKSKKVVIN